MEENQIVRIQPTTIIKTVGDAEQAARAMVQSGFFADTKQLSQAVVKILAGQELGFGPFASMTGVHIIQNKPVLSANLMAAAVKRTGKYNYRVTNHTEQECTIDFYEGKEKVGTSTFTMRDAQLAGVGGKDNWKKYPRNMLFARALSNGQKWFAPDVFGGATVYTPDELGGDVDEEGNLVNAPIIEVIPATPKSEPLRYQPEQLRARLAEISATIRSKIADGKAEPCTGTHRKILAAALGKIPGFDQDTVRYETCDYLCGCASTKDMPGEYVKAMLAWLEVKSFDELPSDMAKREAVGAHNAALIAKGQTELPLEGSNVP